MSNQPEIIEPTAAQLKAWSDTRAALVWHAPAFTHILYTMMDKHKGEHIAVFTRDVPIAATDGASILINPDTFFQHTLMERIFVVAHEISHGIFGHVELMHKLRLAGKVCYPDGKELGYDHETMNKAMDYVINDMLIESKIGTYNSNWLHDPVIATHADDVLTAYRRLYQATGGNSGGTGNGQSPNSNSKGQQPFDQHLDPGTMQGQDATQAANGRNAVEWKTAIAGAAASARAQGKMPAALDKLLSEVLEPVVDWTDKVIGFFNRKPGGGSYNWRQPDRRFITRGIIAPARTGFGAGPIVVALDTSGSVWSIVEKFFAEMYGILDDVRPTQIYLMFCDAQVGRVDEVADTGDLMEVRMKKAPGGGGTAFEPVFDKIEEMGIQPDCLIYLTDGDGSFPQHAPSYPVLWGDISGKESKYPFGEVIHVPLKPGK